MKELKVGDKGRHEYDMTRQAHLEIIEVLPPTGLNPSGRLKVKLLNPQAWIDEPFDDYIVSRTGFIKY